MINKIAVNINNSDCGDLKAVNSHLKNSVIASDKVSLCYGFDEGQMPISNIKLFIKREARDIVPAECTREIVKNKFINETKTNNKKLDKLTFRRMRKSQRKARFI